MVGRKQRENISAGSDRNPRAAVRALAFADIVGSSQLAEAHELDAFRCMQRFRRVLRREVRSLDGRIADEAGDGVLVSFPCPTLAVRWAIRAHEQVARRCRASGAQHPLRLRIGIHVGEVLLYGARVFGRNVNLACRLQQAAAPGQTLVSADVVASVNRELALDAAAAGWVELKGLPTSVAAFRVGGIDDQPRAPYRQSRPWTMMEAAA